MVPGEAIHVLHGTISRDDKTQLLILAMHRQTPLGSLSFWRRYQGALKMLMLTKSQYSG